MTVFISLAELLQLKGQLGAAHDGVVVVVKVFVVVAGQRAGFPGVMTPSWVRTERMAYGAMEEAPSSILRAMPIPLSLMPTA